MAMESAKIYDRMMPRLEPEGLTIKVLKRRILRSWPWFVALGFTGLLLALAYYRLAPPYYRLSSTVLVKNDNKSVELNAIFRDFKVNQNNPVIEDQLGVLKSYNLNFRTMQYLNWRYTWYEWDLLSKHDLYGDEPFGVAESDEASQLEGVPLMIKPISESEYLISSDTEIEDRGRKVRIDFEETGKFGEVFKNKYFQFTIQAKPDKPVKVGERYTLVFNNISQMALAYKEKLVVKPVNPIASSNLIVLELKTRNLARDVDYLNQLGRVYIQFGLDEKNRIANNTIKFIDDQITGVDRSLQQAGDQFSSFRARNRTVDLGQEASTVVEKLKQIESERSSLDLKLEYYNNLKFYLENRDQNKDLLAPSLVGVTDDALNTKVIKLNELYTKREVLSYTAQERNPVLISLNNEISYSHKALRENVENLIANTMVEIQNLNERQRSVNYELSKLPKTEQDLIGIKRNFDLNNELYTFLLQRRAEAEISRASNNPDAQILDPTDTDIAELLGPILIVNLLIGLFGGLFAALCIVIVREAVSEVLDDVEDITSRLDVAVLGSIGVSRYRTETPVIEYPRSALAESFRGLRVNLEHLFKTTDSKVLGIHSCLSGEGKSFVAINLASVFAMSNKRVLLVDGDLRKPRLHRILGIKDTVGLSSYLAGESSLEEIIVPSRIPNLDIVTSGSNGISSSENLNNGIIKNLIENARQLYDFVIFDNSPIGIVYDPLIIGAHTDFNLILLRLNYSRKEQIEGINRIGHDGILKKVMVAVNGVKQHKGNGYYTDESVDSQKSAHSHKVDEPESESVQSRIASFVQYLVSPISQGYKLFRTRDHNG